jgi:hypothetical protein
MCYSRSVAAGSRRVCLSAPGACVTLSSRPTACSNPRPHNVSMNACQRAAAPPPQLCRQVCLPRACTCCCMHGCCCPSPLCLLEPLQGTLPQTHKRPLERGKNAYSNVCGLRAAVGPPPPSVSPAAAAWPVDVHATRRPQGGGGRSRDPRALAHTRHTEARNKLQTHSTYALRAERTARARRAAPHRTRCACHAPIGITYWPSTPESPVAPPCLAPHAALARPRPALAAIRNPSAGCGVPALARASAVTPRRCGCAAARARAHTHANTRAPCCCGWRHKLLRAVSPPTAPAAAVPHSCWLSSSMLLPCLASPCVRSRACAARRPGRCGRGCRPG